MFFERFTKANIKGVIGEGVSRLFFMGLDTNEYKVLHNITLQNSQGKTTQIDHIIVSIYGIFVVETKNYQGWIYGNEIDRQWTQVIYKKRQQFYNPIKQNQGHIRALKGMLPEYKNIPFISIINFSPKATLKEIQIHSSHVYVVYTHRVNPIIKSMKAPVLSHSEIVSITERIQQQNNKALSSEHIINIRNKKNNINDAIAKRICPYCSGQLVNRTGPYGNFLGCSNYPKCRFNGKL
ncbi:NERD domain-containing protein [Sporosarcina sp. Marseille-Q4063]|uniref:NERD domain-containing protein n=1 Tax=Sporosarcina sp. Marseille-Q4063 TaxID=2810514 RepID=UPI001BAF923E|nr:NERD domain-containing protein [Sporosarcina sp. Marseille-Q4063]QUW23010.1 NERD domain-containing protein [Sporosarcina sp. Marseille-Q4063]